MDLNRRKLIGGLTAFIAAPAIIRVAGIMPIKAFQEVTEHWAYGYARVPLGGVQLKYLVDMAYKAKHGYHPEDPDLDIRVEMALKDPRPEVGSVRWEEEYRQMYVEHDDGYILLGDPIRTLVPKADT